MLFQIFIIRSGQQVLLDQCGYKPLGVSFIDFVKKMFGRGRLLFIGGDDRSITFAVADLICFEKSLIDQPGEKGNDRILR